MRFLVAVAVAVVVLAFAGVNPARAAENGAPAKLEWVERPDGDALTRYYPEGAMGRDLNGLVVLRCRIGVDGGLEACKVVREEPDDEGFGAAALALAWSFKAKVPTAGGDPVGREIDLPIRFTMPASAAAAEAEAADVGEREAARALLWVVLAWLAGSIALTGLLTVWPMRRLFKAAGVDRGLAFLFFVPGLNVLAPWIAAAAASERPRPDS